MASSTTPEACRVELELHPHPVALREMSRWRTGEARVGVGEVRGTRHGLVWCGLQFQLACDAIACTRRSVIRQSRHLAGWLRGTNPPGSPLYLGVAGTSSGVGTTWPRRGEMGLRRGQEEGNNTRFLPWFVKLTALRD